MELLTRAELEGMIQDTGGRRVTAPGLETWGHLDSDDDVAGGAAVVESEVLKIPSEVARQLDEGTVVAVEGKGEFTAGHFRLLEDGGLAAVHVVPVVEEAVP